MSTRLLSNINYSGVLLGVTKYTELREIYSSLASVNLSRDNKTNPHDVQNALVKVSERIGGNGIDKVDDPQRVAHQEMGNTVLLYIKRSDESLPTVIFDVETDDFYVDILDQYRKVVGL